MRKWIKFCVALGLSTTAYAMPWTRQATESPSSRWQDLPLLVVDNEEHPDKDVFGLEAAWALIIPIPERVVLLPVVENYQWQGERLPLAVVDPIVFDNPGTEGLCDMFASLETNGQKVVQCFLLAKGHAPDIVTPAPITYYMQTRSFGNRPYFAYGLWRVSWERWEGVRRDLEAELDNATLTQTQGFTLYYSELDRQIAMTNLLAGGGFSLRTWYGLNDGEMLSSNNEVTLSYFEAGTVFSICLTEQGRRTLRGELLAEESHESFQAAEARAREIRRAAEAKDAAEKAQREQAMLQRMHEAVAAAPKVPDGKTAGEKCVIKLPGGASMTMVWCPPGSFWMGSPEEEDGRRDNETRHYVTLTRGFWMAETEVTQMQWESVMGSNPSRDRGRNLPVDVISWFAACEFCCKVGQGFQLPTEAQWEYACRAGSEGPYAGTGDLGEMGWFGENSKTRRFLGGTFWGECKKHRHPVGQKAPNAWGLRDMHGNVREWCEDIYGAYANGETADPTGAGTGERRVVRDGDYYSYPEECRSARRSGCCAHRRYYSVGFRPVIVGGGASEGAPAEKTSSQAWDSPVRW